MPRAASPDVMLRLLILLWLAFLPALQAAAEEPPAAADAPVLQVFVREGCPHCADAKVFLSRLGQTHPDIRIVYRAVDRDPAARDELVEISREAGVWPPGVPTFVFDKQVRVGFDDGEHAGRELVALLGAPVKPRDAVEFPIFGTLRAGELGLPVFTLALGLIDGFNPCAMWVLLFLLALLVRLQDRRRMALVAGTFVLASGAVYYAFMAAWLNLFLLIGLSRASELALGAIAVAAGVINLKDFHALGRGITLSIPAAAKPGIHARLRRIVQQRSLLPAIAGTVVFAILVQLVELLCTSGFPAVYTRILTTAGLEPWTYYAYLLLYNLMYMLDDVAVLAVGVITLSRHRLQEREGRRLKLLAGAVLLALGVYLLLPHGAPA